MKVIRIQDIRKHFQVLETNVAYEQPSDHIQQYLACIQTWNCKIRYRNRITAQNIYIPTKCRMYINDRNITNTKWQTLMEWVSFNAVGYSGNQPLRMVKYQWQTEGIKFIIITKQTCTEPSRLWKSLSNCHGMLWSPQYSHQKQHEIVAASPYCLNFCTKQNQKHASLSSITSSLMYVYPLYCMFHSVCLPSYHMFHNAVCPLLLVP